MEEAPSGGTARERPAVAVRFHGRGGQGVVTAAELLSVAAFEAGWWSQAFPSFGSERAGAPVVAFCRVAGRPIRTRAPITRPDVVIVQDSTLLASTDCLAGLAPEGWLLVNSRHDAAALGLDLTAVAPGHVATLPATDLAMAHVGRPVPNAVLLGGLAALGVVVELAAVEAALTHRFPGPLGEANVGAARAAHGIVAAELGGKEVAGAAAD